MPDPKISGGYILLSRKLIESGIMSKPPEYLKVWIYLLSKASHKPRGNLQRGQGFVNIPELIDMLSYKVGYRTEKPSRKKVFGIIEWLRNPDEGSTKVTTKEPMIVTTKVTHGMLYTIVKYDFYQCPSNYEGNNESNDEGTTKVQRRERQGNNINKNDKNDKNDNPMYTSEIVTYLNEVVGTRYRDTSKKTRDLIAARINEGYTVDDFKRVIDIKSREWLNTDMAKYLRPETLFSNKFEGYLNQRTTISQVAGQPSYFRPLEYEYED